MSLKLYRRDGFWHYRGTIGPPDRRKRFRGSTGLEATPKNRATAQRYVTQEIEEPYWRGRLDGPEAILTFDVACQRYLADGRYDQFLEPMREALGKMLVKDIKPSTVRAKVNEMFGHCTGASKNRLGITPVQSVINFCASAELCSPIKVKRFDEYTKIKEPATLDWVTSFMGAANDLLGPYALFMFLTGCRPTEGLEVDPERDLDLNARTCIINNGKVGHERKAHLPAILVTALANMPRQPGRPLFWYRTYNSMSYQWRQAVKLAGIKKLTPHCCRHGCVTELLRRGIDVVTVGWLVDMTPEMVLETYGHALKDATLTDRLTGPPLTRALYEVADSAIKTGTS
jgi:integrase